VDRNELFVAPAFDGALPFEVNNHGTLFRLQGIVTAGCDQALNDVVKGVVIVVEQHNVPLVVEQDVGQDIFLSFNL